MASRRQSLDERATKLGLIGFFWTMFAVMSLLKGDNIRRPGALEFVMLGLATFRMGRLIAFDSVAEPLRAPFTKTVPDESGAGDTVVAKGRGPREVIGELLSCPICAGTWIAAGLTYGLQLLPGPTRLLISVMSAIGLAEVLHSVTEALSWLGTAERHEVGKASNE